MGGLGRNQQALRQLDAAIDASRAEGINLDDFSDADLEMPIRPDPALTLAISPQCCLVARRLPLSEFRIIDTKTAICPKRYASPRIAIFLKCIPTAWNFGHPECPAFPDLRPYRS
jgi:hypothetical protein